MVMPSFKHYWRSLYGCTYIGMGLSAFLLKTHELSEIIIRFLFISLGVILLFANRRIAILILSIGGSLLSFWLFFALAIIINHWDDAGYRTHVLSMPLFVFFGVQHYKAIRELALELKHENG